MPNISKQVQERVDDILCAALEGGITYWCDRAECVGSYPEGAEFLSEVLSRGGTIRLHDADENKWHALTLRSFQSGIAKAAKDFGVTVERFHEDHDAGWADNAVQYAIFGEVVYG